MSQGTAGTLTITSVSITGYPWLLDTLRQFRLAYPKVQLVIKEMPSAHQAKALGVALVPQSIARSMPRDKVAFVPLTAAPSSVGLYLNWNTDNTSPLAGHFFSVRDEAM